MKRFLKTTYSIKEINSLSTLALAYIGDAVYELCTRVHVFDLGNFHSLDMHKSAVKLVNAKAQSTIATKLLDSFTEVELDYFKRGRNAKVNSVPSGATPHEYHMATGLETVFGFLYLSGQTDRIDELYSIAINEN